LSKSSLLGGASEVFPIHGLLKSSLLSTKAKLFPREREYALRFGLDRAALGLAKPDVLVMHPGPINRGVELAPDVADGPESVILEQVANGIIVRMAVLYHCAGGAGGDA